MIAANSHRTGLVQSILTLGVSILLAMVMCFQSRFLPRPLLHSLPAEGGRRESERLRRMITTRRFAPTSWFETARKRLLTMRRELNPKQPRITCLDFVSHFLDASRVLLHQLDVGDLAAARLSASLADGPNIAR